MKNEYAIAILIAVFGFGAVIGQTMAHSAFQAEKNKEYTEKLENTLDCIEINGVMKNGVCTIKWED